MKGGIFFSPEIRKIQLHNRYSKRIRQEYNEETELDDQERGGFSDCKLGKLLLFLDEADTIHRL